MAKVFDKIIVDGVRQGKIPARTQDARDWYRDIARGSRVSEGKLLENKDRLANFPTVGEMFMFKYDAKYKDTLPYWDALPCIFVVDIGPDYFYGLNLHYLDIRNRAKLMDALYEITNNTRYDNKTKLAISYKILKSAAKFKYFKPCFKKYLFSHKKSQFIRILSSEWDIALWLPTAQWQKKTGNYVHAQSRKMING